VGGRHAADLKERALLAKYLFGAIANHGFRVPPKAGRPHGGLLQNAHFDDSAIIFIIRCNNLPIFKGKIMYSKPVVSKSIFIVIILAACLLLTSVAQAQGQSGSRVTQKSAEHSNSVFNREEALRERKSVHDWLVRESVGEGLAAPIVVRASVQEKDEIDQANRNESPFRVGLTKAVSRSISFGDLRSSRINRNVLKRDNGAMVATDDGGYVFTVSVNSPDASAMRLQFRGFRLADNAALYLYTEDGQVFGPYSGRGLHKDGEFWSHTLVGDHVIMQLRHTGPFSDEDLRHTSFQLAGVAHLRPRFLAGHCSSNTWCVENPECEGTHLAVNDARNAVAHMQWISGRWAYMCSGGLIADTDTGYERPLFLTAAHCISRAKDARTLENFFQYTAACGITDCDDPAPETLEGQSLRTLGATILATNKNTDFTLFELDEMPPAGSTYLGWNSEPVAFTAGTRLYRIHHPGGSPQAYSEHEVDTTSQYCGGWPRGDRIYSRDVLGATEGGSSGSPLVNSAGQIVGQLTGACGTNLDDVCDSENNATVDGAFAAYFDRVSAILGPGCAPTESTEESCSDGDDNDCDGDVDAADSDCHGDVCTSTESTEVSCSDGVDNDCDGLVDEDDPHCTTGGGGDLPVGASCTANDQCSSNKCKGKPRAKTCK
jgi:V8-like Glu-specific endopeptidase